MAQEFPYQRPSHRALIAEPRNDLPKTLAGLLEGIDNLVSDSGGERKRHVVII
jgi:hypothetical protein